MKKIYAIIIAIAMTMSSSAVYADDTLVSRQVKNQDTIEINPSAPPTETPNQAQAESINETVSPTETPISTITTDKSKTDLIFDNILSLKENYDIKSKIENAIDTNGVLLDEESRRDFIEQFSDIQEKIDEIIIEDQTFVDVCNQNTDYQLLHDLYVKMLDYQTQLDTNVPMLFSEIPNPKVTYDANGGTGSVPEVQDYTINTRVNVRFSPLPKKDYYVFSGWSKTKKAVNDLPDYATGGTTSFTITGDITLYATWKSGTIQVINQSINGLTATTKFQVNFVGVPTGTIQYGIVINGITYPADTGSLINNSGVGSYTVTTTTLIPGSTITANAKIGNQVLSDYLCTVTVVSYDPSSINFNGSNYTLSPVLVGTKMSTDEGQTWHLFVINEVSSGVYTMPNNFSGSSIWIAYFASDGTLLSSIRKITITKAAVPTATTVQPITVNGTGSIKNISSNAEYSTNNGTSWQTVTGDLNNLAQGTTILLRTKGSINTLPSDNVSITINRISQMNSSTYSVVGYVGNYDGSNHNSVSITSTIQGATILYGTNAGSLSAVIPQIKDVGSTTIYYSISASGYETVTGSVVTRVNPKTLMATYSGESIFYGASPTLQVNVSGFVTGETSASDPTFQLPRIQNTNLIPGSYTLTPSGGNPGKNYVFNYVSGTLVINKGNLGITVTGYQGTYDGGLHGVTIANNDATQILYSVNNGTATSIAPQFKNAGVYSVKVQAIKTNYEIKEFLVEVNIKQKDITVEVASINNKTYDGNTIASGNLIVKGVVGNDSVNALGTYNFIDKNAGELKKVFVNHISLNGSDAGNYNLTTSELESSGTIYPVVALLTWSGTDTRTYDGIASQVNATITNAIGQESVTVTLEGNSEIDAGSYTATATQLSDTNYTLEGANSTAAYIISPRQVTYSWSNINTRVYDGTPSQVSAAITNLVQNDTASLSISNGNQVNAGIYVASISGIQGVDAGNYSLPTEGLLVPYTITRAVLTATVSDESIMYGYTPLSQIEVTGFVNQEDASTASGYQQPITTITTISSVYPNVGTYHVVLSGGSATNYRFLYDDGMLTINKANLTVTSSGYVEIYDGNDHTISVQVQEDDSTIMYGLSVGQYDLTNAPTFSNVGSTTIYYKVENPNYNDVFGSEIVTIQKKTVTPTVLTVSDKIYDGNQSTTGTLGLIGVLPKDEGTVTVSGVFAFTNKNVEAIKYVNVSKIIFDTTVQNYTLDSNQLTNIQTDAQIKPVELLATYHESVNYDDTIPTSVTVTGFVNNENESNADGYSAPSIEIPGYDVGTYSVLPKDGQATNYTFIYQAGYLTIVPINMVFTTTDYQGIYDAQEHNGHVAVTMPDSNIEITYSTSKDGNYTVDEPVYRNVGNYTYWYRIHDTGAVDDYNDVQGVLAVMISPHIVKAQIDSVSDKVYDGTTDTSGMLTLDYIGSGDDLGVQGVIRFDDKNVGDSKIVDVTNLNLTGDSAINYRLEDSRILDALTTSKITKKQITIIWSSQNQFVYQGINQGVIAMTNDFLPSDDVTLVLENNMNTDVGTYTAKIIELQGVDNINYQLPTNLEQEYSITPKLLTVRYVGESIVYTGSPHFRVVVDGFVANQNINNINGFSLPIAFLAQWVAGRTYTVTPTGGNPGSNYAFNYVGDSLAVLLANMEDEVKGEDSKVMYDGQPHSVSVIAPEDATVTKQSYTAPGTYTIQWKVEKENYESVSGSNILIIQPKEIDPTPTPTPIPTPSPTPVATTQPKTDEIEVLYIEEVERVKQPFKNYDKNDAEEVLEDENPAYQGKFENGRFMIIGEDKAIEFTKDMTIQIGNGYLVLMYSDDSLRNGTVLNVEQFINAVLTPTELDGVMQGDEIEVAVEIRQGLISSLESGDKLENQVKNLGFSCGGFISFKIKTRINDGEWKDRLTFLNNTSFDVLLHLPKEWIDNDDLYLWRVENDTLINQQKVEVHNNELKLSVDALGEYVITYPQQNEIFEESNEGQSIVIVIVLALIGVAGFILLRRRKK
ncbi:MAG: MBG domain-containing protein [Anaerorhabdus sp.]|uniref:MBG domain-containing protein n=1 Tax=Anaerorhabdus sp. TaxID=1872524 RepID=UPI002FCB78F8